MAGFDYYHTAEILQAAIPYVDYKTQSLMDFSTKFLDFMGSFQNFSTNSNIAACGFENDHIDIEGMLAGIRPVCNEKEREFVDSILNIFNAKRIFETYNNYMSVMKSMQGNDSTSYSEPDYGSGSDYDSYYDSDSSANASSQSNTSSHSNSSSSSRSNSSNTSGGGFNPGMLNMLKAFIPPEQASTFENLSMLLNTMSYDSNKSDNS